MFSEMTMNLHAVIDPVIYRARDWSQAALHYHILFAFLTLHIPSFIFDYSILEFKLFCEI